MYAYGLGVPKDDDLAFEWIRKAAEAGLTRAQYNLGKMYCDGTVTKVDFAESVRWYRMAADSGYDKAQAGLGQRYALVQGVEKDYVQALFWTTLAANQGLERAVEKRKALMGQILPTKIAAAEKLTADWLPVAK